MGFSTYNHESRRFIKARAQSSDEEFRRKARVALKRLCVSPRIEKSFDLLVGANDGWLDMREATAANGRGRIELRKRISRALALLARRNPELDFIFGSIIHQPWHTMSDNTVIDLADMQQRTRNVIKMCGFKGAVIMLEIQAEPGGRRSNSWPLYPNVHFIGWVDPGFNKRKAGERVRKSTRLTRFEQSRVLVLSNKMKPGPDLWRRICYLVKEGYSGKKLHKVSGRFEKTIQGMHPDACLRLTEVLSYIRLPELLMLTGDATVLRKRLLSPISTASDVRAAPDRTLPRPACLWDAIRASDPNFYPPVQVLRTAKRVESEVGAHGR